MFLLALKPVFPLTEKRIKKERLLISYRILEHDLDCIASESVSAVLMTIRPNVNSEAHWREKQSSFCMARARAQGESAPNLRRKYFKSCRSPIFTYQIRHAGGTRTPSFASSAAPATDTTRTEKRTKSAN